MAGKKNKEQEAPKVLPTAQELDDVRLAKYAVGKRPLVDLYKLASEYGDIEVKTFSTGFPQLDRDAGR